MSSAQISCVPRLKEIGGLYHKPPSAGPKNAPRGGSLRVRPQARLRTLFACFKSRKIQAEIGIPVACAVVYALLSSFVAFGVVPDMGLFRADHVPFATHMFLIGLVPAVFLVTLWQARLSRRATLDAIQRSNEAIRLARHREAQINEANQNLDMALRAVAGGEGRYTGARAGKYILAEVIGRGAMGETLLSTPPWARSSREVTLETTVRSGRASSVTH